MIYKRSEELKLIEYFYQNYERVNNKYYNKFKIDYEPELAENEDEIFDDDDAIYKWKQLVYPANRNPESVGEYKANAYFGLLSFYLYSKGYEIEEYPQMLSKWRTLSDVSDGDLKEATRRIYSPDGGNVLWADRRTYINFLTFNKKHDSLLSLEIDLEEIISSVSPRNAKFNDKSLDEKLSTIRDAFENIGKKNGKYLTIPYENLSVSYLSSDKAQAFAKELQCFRHGEATLVAKRASYTEEQKLFMIDYGMMLLNLAYRFVKSLSYD